MHVLFLGSMLFLFYLIEMFISGKKRKKEHMHVTQPLQHAEIKMKTERKALKNLVFVHSGENQTLKPSTMQSDHERGNNCVLLLLCRVALKGAP